VCSLLLTKVAVSYYFVVSFHFVNIFIQANLENRFGITSEDWKQIQVHIDSKCRSAYRCKSRGLSQSVRAFRRRSAEQTSACTDEPGTSFVETYSNDAEPQPQQNTLIAEVGFTLLAVKLFFCPDISHTMVSIIFWPVNASTAVLQVRNVALSCTIKPICI